MRAALLRAVLGATLVTASAGVSAATVELANGDRLSGEIVSLADGTLVLKTGYAGEVKIAWAEVRRIDSDSRVSVMLQDRTLISGSLSSPAPGQIRIESEQVGSSAPIAMEQVGWLNPPQEILGGGPRVKGRANLGFNLSQGNTETQRTHADAETVVKYRRSRYTLGATFNQASDENGETEFNSSGYGKYDYFLDDKWYVYSNALFTKDKFQDLKLRTSLGLGSGYQFFESEARNLSVEGGLNYVNEDYEVGEDDAYPSGRWSINYDQLLFGSAVQFFHFQEGYVGLEDIRDFFFRSNTGFRVPLTADIQATAQFDLDFDNTPAPGRERMDTRYLLNLGYKW